MSKFLRRSLAAEAPEPPKQTKRLRRKELEGRTKAKQKLKEGKNRLQRPEEEALTQDTARTPRHGCHQGGPPVKLDQGW